MEPIPEGGGADPIRRIGSGSGPGPKPGAGQHRTAVHTSPSLGRPLPGQSPADRTSGRPRATPVMGIGTPGQEPFGLPAPAPRCHLACGRTTCSAAAPPPLSPPLISFSRHTRRRRVCGTARQHRCRVFSGLHAAAQIWAARNSQRLEPPVISRPLVHGHRCSEKVTFQGLPPDHHRKPVTVPALDVPDPRRPPP